MIVTVQSFRGGVGKSSIAINLALDLILQKKKTALIDLDIFAPSLHLRIDQDPRNIGFTMNDYLLGLCDLNKVKKSINIKNTNIDFYPSSIELQKISQLFENGYDLGMLSRGIKEIEKQNDIVLIDNHSSITEEAIGVLTISDVVLLVTTPDISAMEGIFLWRDVVSKFNIKEKNVIIILNKVLASKQDINKIQDRLYAGSKKKADFVFFFYEEVALESSKESFPIRLQHPRSVFSKNISKLSANIMGLG